MNCDVGQYQRYSAACRPERFPKLSERAVVRMPEISHHPKDVDALSVISMWLESKGPPTWVANEINLDKDASTLQKNYKSWNLVPTFRAAMRACRFKQE